MRQNQNARAVAMGGVFSAIAVAIMCLGTLIPVAVFVCPVVCCLLCGLYFKLWGSAYSWAWYGAVALLSVLMAPDKEAAALFCLLGFYPILKPKFDGTKLPVLWKLLLFNGEISLFYGLLLKLFGMDALAEEYAALGAVMGAVMYLLGNVTFLMLDRLLSTPLWKVSKYRN